MLFHRHIFRSVAFACGGGIAFFTFIVLSATVMKDMVELLTSGRLTLGTFLQLVWLVTPYVLIHALPVGLLTGVLVALGRLSSDNEILALRASGVSIMRLSSSILVFAIFATGLSLLVNLQYGPESRAKYRQALAESVSTNPLGFIIERTFIKDFPGYIVYVGKKEGNDLKDFWVWRLDDEKRVTRFMRAEQGIFDFDKESGVLNLKLRGGIFEDRDREDPESLRTGVTQLTFQSAEIPLSLDRIMGRTLFQRKLYWLPFMDLQRERTRREGVYQAARDSGEDFEEQRLELNEVNMTLQEKMASSFAPFTLTLIGIPLGIVTSRKETSANLFIALGLALLYFGAMMSVSWLGQHPGLRPDLLYWIPNFVLQGVGFWLIQRQDRGLGKARGRKIRQVTA